MPILSGGGRGGGGVARVRREALATEEQPLSQVMPVLLAGLICEVGAVDPNSGKKSLIGIFDRLTASNFPIRIAMSLYLKFTDAEGDYRFQIEFAHTESGETAPPMESDRVHIPDRIQSYDFLVPIPAVEFPRPGRYEFRIKCNQAFLGFITLDVIQQGGAS